MAELVIGTNKRAEKKGTIYRSFEDTINSRIGRGYVIYRSQLNRLRPGDKVIVVRNDAHQRRAEGVLSKPPTPNGQTSNNQPRYDVSIRNLKVVPYRAERLGRTGVAVR